MTGRPWIGLLLAATLPGCALNVDYQRLNRHVIACDREGIAYDPKTGTKLNQHELQAHIDGLLGRAFASLAADARAHPDQPRRLLIHVHGGLNTEAESLGAADRAIPRILEEPNSDDRCYPIFITWDSGLVSSYWEYVSTLRRGRHAPLWGPITAPVYFLTDLLHGIISLPRNWIFQTGMDVALGAKVAFDTNLLPSWRNAARAASALADVDAESARSRGEVLARVGPYSRGFFAQGLRLCSYLVTLPTKIISSIFVGQGFGQGSWDGMQHSASNLFHRWEEFDLLSVQEGDPELVRRQLRQMPTGAFAVFLRRLSRFYEEEKAKPANRGARFQIILVGHSMGAIIINSALELLTSPPTDDCGISANLPIDHIVYMGAAASVGETASAVVPYLLAHPTARFHLLTLHPNAEAEETNFLDLPPRGSLLEWIDNFYGRAVNPQDRRVGKWINAIQSLHLFREIADRMTVKAFGVDGDSKPTKHGDFNLCPYWQHSFWDPLGPMVY